MIRFQLWGEGGKYWLQEYRTDNPTSEKRLVWHETRQDVDYAYIEPCGAVPDGMFIPMGDIQRLLDNEVVTPHERDDEYERDGIGFDPMGGTESEQEERNVSILDTLERL